MRMLLNKVGAALGILIFFVNVQMAQAAPIASATERFTIDRPRVITHQIALLKSRYTQLERELKDLQSRHDEQFSSLLIEKASKSLEDKAALDISVAKSNLDSINMETEDSQQMVDWLDKNIQEIENQLNVMSIFGLKVPRRETRNLMLLEADLRYQRKLLGLEKTRRNYLHDLQYAAKNVFQLKIEHLAKLKEMLKSRQLLYLKKKQVKDELAYQEDQNHWLQTLNAQYAKLEKIDPSLAPEQYTSIERTIFYANEKASFAYVHSLIARYKDQIQQMHMAISRGNSITQLNEVNEQMLLLNKQIGSLENVAKSRAKSLRKHIKYLDAKQAHTASTQQYIHKLQALFKSYGGVNQSIDRLDNDLSQFRLKLDKALQIELSSRQGLPIFNIKSLLDVGRELLLIPTLAFQVVKSLGGHLYEGVANANKFAWGVYLFAEAIMLIAFFYLRNAMHRLVDHSPHNRDRISAKWIALQFVHRNFVDIFLISNAIATLYYFAVPMQNYAFIVDLSVVWLVFKAVITVARLWLVESTHDSEGHDVRLYQHLRVIMFAGVVITSFTVFLHQLPLIFELKIISARLFLFAMLLFSISLLRSHHVILHMILSHMEKMHPYIEKVIRMMGIVVPLILLVNSVVGLLGYVNLVKTVSWYQGVFLMVMIGYLVISGLLSDGMMQVSRLMIRHTDNGWLWTEAFLKPLDKIVQIALFLTSWATLFLLYGWDKQSPIVERITLMLHYKLANVLNTTITPLSIIALFVVMSVFYWTAKWTREFVYRAMSKRTSDMGIRNSIAILSQYSVVIVGAFICLRVLDIDLRALFAVASIFALGVGLGLRDLANNFVCGFLILLERPLRVGDLVSVNGLEGEVLSIGSRAVRLRTWDRLDALVPNAEIFNKSFTNWTAQDDVIRVTVQIKISRHDNPHEVRMIMQNVMMGHDQVLNDPAPEIYLKDMSETVMAFDVRYYIDVRQVPSRAGVKSAVLMSIWDEFARHDIKPPYPQQEILISSGSSRPGAKTIEHRPLHETN